MMLIRSKLRLWPSLTGEKGITNKIHIVAAFRRIAVESSWRVYVFYSSEMSSSTVKTEENKHKYSLLILTMLKLRWNILHLQLIEQTSYQTRLHSINTYIIFFLILRRLTKGRELPR